MKKPEFKTHEAWFRAQYNIGKSVTLPNTDTIKLYARVNEIRYQLEQAEAELQRAVLRQCAFTASRYVWSMGQTGDIPRLKTAKSTKKKR